MMEFIPFEHIEHDYFDQDIPSEIFPDFTLPLETVSFYLPGREHQSTLARGEVQNVEFNGQVLRTEWVTMDDVEGVLVTVIVDDIE